MRPIIWFGMLGAMICAVGSYLAAGYLSRDSRSPVEARNELTAEATAFSQAELLAVDGLLPDPANLLAEWHAFETIDLLSGSKGNPTSPKQAEGAQQLASLLPENLLPQTLVPAGLIRSTDEAECFPLMPHSGSETSAVLMDRLDRVLTRCEASEASEEQEAERAELPVDPKLVEERLKRILESYLQSGRLNGRAGVDTMEFRSSDAKKSEFDRIPF